MNIKKFGYKLRRFLGSYFTYHCVCCQKAVLGDCLCNDCKKDFLPADDLPEDFSFAYYYEGAPKKVILCYKFEKEYKFCCDTLCDWLFIAFEKFKSYKIDFAVPVPSFEKPENRLYYLAKQFCTMAEIPFEPSVLKKIRKTEKQHNLSGKERRTNLINAFEAEDSVFGKTVLLIDDICTTGSTVSECSKALYDTGAKRVLVLTIFKTK